MARYAIVENGIVTNIATGDAEWAAKVDAVQSDEAQIGWRYENGVFTDPTPATAPPPARIVRITAVQAELALLQWDMLDAIEAYILTLPRATQIRWRRMQVLERDDATLTEAWAARGGTADQLDALFALGATL